MNGIKRFRKMASGDQHYYSVRLPRISENVVKVCASRCFGYPLVIFDGQLDQLVEHRLTVQGSWVGNPVRSVAFSPFLLQLNFSIIL
jgi:hypothetical protein